MPSLGDLTVHLGAVTQQFHRDLNSAEGRLKGVATAMRRVVDSASKLGLAAGAAGAAVIAGLVKSGLSAIDTQAKLARNIGATIGGLRALEMAAGDAGVSQEQLAQAVEQFTQRLGEAARGQGRAKDMLDALGLEAEELIRMDIDTRFATIADRVRELGLNTAQTADLLRQFGIRNVEMVDLLRMGGDAIREQGREIDRLGLRLSAIDASQIEAANDAMGVFEDVLVAVRDRITVAVAPLITELSERFRTMAIDAGGFGDHAMKGIEIGIRAFGKFLDVVHGVRVAIKGAELILTGFGAAAVSVVQIAAEAFTQYIDNLYAGVNFAIKQLNRLPKVDIPLLDSVRQSDFMERLREFGDAARNQVGVVRSELHELAMTEMPSSKFERFLEAVKNRAREAATQLNEVRAAMGNEGAAGFAAEEDPEQVAAEQADEQNRERIAARLQAIRDGLMEEEELVTEYYKRDLEALREALELKLLTEEEFADLRRQLEENLMSDLADIRKRGMSELEKFTTSSFKNQAKTVASELANMTASVANQSKRMFAINKAAGIANAIINTAEGVTKALSAYPPPLSFAMAAAQAAAGAAQIQSIKAQQFGGGGAAPSLAGSTPAPPVTPVSDGSGPSQQRTMVIKGLDPNSLFSGRQLRLLAEAMIEFQKDGGKVVLQ